jgi:glycosyltransferase involved in cell wall biosynthesis/GT2 family glycosyltransferase
LKTKIKPTCSVLIVVKNEPSLARTLEVLRSQVEDINGECIVIDASGSALKSIQDANPWVKWINFEQPLGSESTISIQRNLAVREAQSDIFLFCDAGGLPSKNWVNELFTPLSSNEFSVIGGPLEFFHEAKELEKRNFQKRGEQIKYPSCGNIGFTRDAFEKTNGFNEKLLVAEDDDFVRQLEREGILCASIPTAIMRVDAGDRKRQLKRSWRYGRGIVRLLKANPDLRLKRLRQNPDIWLYPILLPEYLGILMASASKPILLLIPLITSIALIARNLRSRAPIFSHISHIVYEAGSIVEITKLLLKQDRQVTIVQFPHDSSPYIEFLNDSLNSGNQISVKFPGLTKSSSLNVFLLPFLTPIMWLFGIRLMNIHWIVGKWQLKWASQPWGRQILWYWFQVWFFSFKCFRMKIIYTVHDLNFQSKVFNDDAKTQKYLMDKADALVFLNDLSKEKVLKIRPKKIFALIPEGPLDIKTSISRSEMRRLLGVPESKILFALVGRLQEYKGIDLLFPAAAQMPGNFAIRIAGACMGSYRLELEALASNAKARGDDIEMVTHLLTDEEFAGYLCSADYFIYPCRDINNSGALNAALSANLPVIVPDMAELDWVHPDCKIVMKTSAEFSLDFEECFARISNMSPASYQNLKTGAEKWKSERSWDKVSDQYTKLYRELLNG